MRSISLSIKARIILAVVFFTALILMARSFYGSDSSQADLAKKPFQLDELQAKDDLAVFTKFPHPFGSEYQKTVAQYFLQRMRAIGFEVALQSFEADVPVPQEHSMSPLTKSLKGENVLAYDTSILQKPCVVLVGSHYDTKIVPGMSYVGANDGGSSSVLLMQLLPYLNKMTASLPVSQQSEACGIVSVWFDGEESQLEGWMDGELSHPARIKDNTYGSRHFVSELSACSWHQTPMKCLALGDKKIPVVGLVLFDLVGSRDIVFSLDLESTSALSKELGDAAKTLGLDDRLTPHWTNIEDDHIPFVKAGIPALNIIDFTHLDTWHRDGDTVQNISLESIETAGILGSYVISRLLLAPQDFLKSAENL